MANKSLFKSLKSWLTCLNGYTYIRTDDEFFKRLLYLLFFFHQVRCLQQEFSALQEGALVVCRDWGVKGDGGCVQDRIDKVNRLNLAF